MTAHDSKRDHCYSHRGVRCNHIHTYMLLSNSIGERVQLVTARAIRLLNIVCQRRCQSQNVYVTYVTRFLYPLQHTQRPNLLYLSGHTASLYSFLAIQNLYTASIVWPCTASCCTMLYLWRWAYGSGRPLLPSLSAVLGVVTPYLAWSKRHARRG